MRLAKRCHPSTDGDGSGVDIDPDPDSSAQTPRNTRHRLGQREMTGWIRWDWPGLWTTVLVAGQVRVCLSQKLLLTIESQLASSIRIRWPLPNMVRIGLISIGKTSCLACLQGYQISVALT